MYETGKREPNFETLEKIADFFNVNIDTLLGKESAQQIPVNQEPTTLGALMQQARIKAGMTQKQLADKLGISFVLISQYECGVKKPKIDTLVKIADILGVTLEDLYTSQTEDNPPCYYLPIASGMVATLDWHARKNHRTLIEELDIAVDSYLDNVAMAGELNETYYTPAGQEKRRIEQQKLQGYLNLELMIYSLNNAGIEKATSFISDLIRIPEYQKDSHLLEKKKKPRFLLKRKAGK